LSETFLILRGIQGNIFIIFLLVFT